MFIIFFFLSMENQAAVGQTCVVVKYLLVIKQICKDYVEALL